MQYSMYKAYYDQFSVFWDLTLSEVKKTWFLMKNNKKYNRKYLVLIVWKIKKDGLNLIK